MNKLLLSLFLITIIASSTGTFAQERKYPVEIGDIVLYSPSKNLAEVTKGELVDGKKLYTLKVVDEKTVEPLIATEDQIADINVMYMEFGNGKDIQRIMPEFINDEKGGLIYGNQKKWDEQPKALRELPPQNGPKIGDTIIEDKLRSGKVTKKYSDHVIIEVKIPLNEITPIIKAAGKIPAKDLPLPRRKPTAIIRNRG